MRASSRATSSPRSHPYASPASDLSRSHRLPHLCGRPRPPPLLVRLRLQGEILLLRPVEEERHDGVAAAVLVHRRGPVPDPLACHEHRHRAVELEFHHLGGRGMPVAAKVADESPGLGAFPRPEPVAHPGRPLDIRVRPHVIDERDEPVVENGEVAAQDLFSGGNSRASRFHGSTEGLSPKVRCPGVPQAVRRHRCTGIERGCGVAGKGPAAAATIAAGARLLRSPSRPDRGRFPARTSPSSARLPYE